MIADSDFEKAFVKIMEKITQKTFGTPREAFEAWKGLLESQKQGMWEDIGRLCSATAKQAHDCFHNRWSRKFFHDITPYKELIRSVVQQNYKTCSITQIITEVQQLLPNKNFHYQTIYQYINYQMKKMAVEGPISPLQKIMSLPPPSLKSLSKCNSSTIEDSADYHPPLFRLSRTASTLNGT